MTVKNTVIPLIFSLTLAVASSSLNADGGDTTEGSTGAAGNGGWNKTPPHLIDSKKRLALEDYQGALNLLQAAMADHPNDADVMNLTGFSYRKLGEFKQALQYYEKALALDPKHKGALEYLGELYLQTDQPELAQVQLARLKKLCTFCRERKMLSKAIRKYRKENG